MSICSKLVEKEEVEDLIDISDREGKEFIRFIFGSEDEPEVSRVMFEGGEKSAEARLDAAPEGTFGVIHTHPNAPETHINRNLSPGDIRLFPWDKLDYNCVAYKLGNIDCVTCCKKPEDPDRLADLMDDIIEPYESLVKLIGEGFYRKESIKYLKNEAYLLDVFAASEIERLLEDGCTRYCKDCKIRKK